MNTFKLVTDSSASESINALNFNQINYRLIDKLILQLLHTDVVK